MIKKIVRYRVKPDKVADVNAAIIEFVDAVRSNEPDTIYGSLVASDGLTFLHAMAFPNDGAERLHREASYTQRFVEALYPNCEHEPEFVDVTVVRSTKKGGGFLGEGS